jgi:hypothetical protein
MTKTTESNTAGYRSTTRYSLLRCAATPQQQHEGLAFRGIKFGGEFLLVLRVTMGTAPIGYLVTLSSEMAQINGPQALCRGIASSGVAGGGAQARPGCEPGRACVPTGRFATLISPIAAMHAITDALFAWSLRAVGRNPLRSRSARQRLFVTVKSLERLRFAIICAGEQITRRERVFFSGVQSASAAYGSAPPRV